MLLSSAGLKGYSIKADDGAIGSVSDALFDDATWMLRWLVVDTGGWLTGRKVLIHPSAIGTPDHAARELPASLTRAQVAESPEIYSDQPVSRQMETNLNSYYGWDPLRGGGGYFGGGLGAIIGPTPALHPGGTLLLDEAGLEIDPHEGDPHLRSVAEIAGYHINATDGMIGHLDTVLIDDAAWVVRYLVVDTRNWWPGKHVLISPHAVQAIDWPDEEVQIDISRDQVKGSPPWSPNETVDFSLEKRLHAYYGWPGNGS